MATRLYSHPVFLEHLTPVGHPERPDRLRALFSVLEGYDYYALDQVEAPVADEQALELVHQASYLKQIKAQIPDPLDEEQVASGMAQPIVNVGQDTYVSPQSWHAVLAATGSALAAVEDVFNGQADNIFIAARPPGHHATADTAMGFCITNTAAIAARYAQSHFGAERVAIIDWDVHHGNGTQDIFAADKNVLFCSTHQAQIYPGTGLVKETGVGNIVNAPLLADSGSREFREAFTSRILPALDNFRPDLILISAGFDGHYLDPLAQLNLTETDYDWVTGQVMERADRFCNNRLISFLEGGYDLQGLSFSAAAHITRLMKG